MKINEKISTLRKARLMTQQELADRVFITKSTISKWESGLQEPSIAMLKKLSEILNVTLEELISDKPLNFNGSSQKKDVEIKKIDTKVSTESFYHSIAWYSKFKNTSTNKKSKVKSWAVNLIISILCLIAAIVSFVICGTTEVYYGHIGLFIGLIFVGIIGSIAFLATFITSMILLGTSKSKQESLNSLIRHNAIFQLTKQGILINGIENEVLLKWSDCVGASVDKKLNSKFSPEFLRKHSSLHGSKSFNDQATVISLNSGDKIMFLINDASIVKSINNLIVSNLKGGTENEG